MQKQENKKQDYAHKAWRQGYGSQREHYCANRVPWRVSPDGSGTIQLFDPQGVCVALVTDRMKSDLALELPDMQRTS